MRLLFIFFICYHALFAQDLVLAKKIQSTRDFDNGLNLAGTVTGKNGDIYVAGSFMDTIRIDSVTLSPTPEFVWYDCNSFVSKYNPAGELTAVISNTGAGHFKITDIVNDSLGNIYLTVRMLGDVTFGDVEVTTEEGIFSYLLIKLDPDFNVLWHKLFENSMPNYTSTIDGISCTKNNDLIVYGTGAYTLDGFELSQAGPFFAKLESLDGTTAWVRQLTTNTSCYLSSLGNENNEIILTGSFGEAFTDSAHLVFNDTDTLRSGSLRGIFLAKYAINGDFLWAKLVDTIFPLMSEAAVDLNDNIFMINSNHTDVLTDNGVHKFSPDGDFLWSKMLTNGYNMGLSGNRENMYYLVGFRDSVVYDSQTIYGGPGEQFVLMKLDPANGDLMWTSRAYNLDPFIRLFTSGNGNCAILGEKNGYIFNKNLIYDHDTTISYMLYFNDRDTYASNGNLIKGNIYNDLNANCLLDGDAGISEYGVVAYPGPIYGISDISGNYELKVDTGNYTVKQIVPIGHAIQNTPVCGIQSHSISFASTGLIADQKDFPNQYEECTYLKVSALSSMISLPCQAHETTSIQVKNFGLDTVFNVQARVKYPGTIIYPLFSSPAWDDYLPQDSLIIYQIGSIPPMASVDIVIQDSVDCPSLVLDETQFPFSVLATPYNTCLLEDTAGNWKHFYSQIVFILGTDTKFLSVPLFKIFPNPAGSILNIEYPGGNPGIGVINITNIVGQRMDNFTCNGLTAPFTYTVHIGDFQQGVYFIEVQDSSGRIQKMKFIKN